MSDVWSHSSDVTPMHPLGGRQVGWDEVRGSWEQVAGLASDGNVELKDQLIHTAGDLAYEIGVEHAQFTLAGQNVTGQARVTNVYQREGGAWKIRHHHTDLIPEMIEIPSRGRP
jgi:ketosteroid isomerase-like protein